jgi:zinc-ribbon domain
MAMKCPNCGNDLSPEEVFCGQCGASITPAAKPTEIVNTPPPHYGLLSGRYNTVASPPPGTYKSGFLPQPNAQPTIGPSGPQQQGNFYQDATEAISFIPNNEQQYPISYPQQSFSGTPMPGAYPGAGQSGPPMQPFQGGNYTSTLYPPTQQEFPTGQGYSVPPGFTPSPRKQGSNTTLIIVCICLALAIITVGAFGAVYLLHNNTPGKIHTASHANASPTSIATPTTVPSPTLAPSPSPTVTASPTAAPDPGFTLCDVTCTSNGFSVEYPSTWAQKPTSDSTGTQFTNPSQPDEFAAFKTPGVVTTTADQLVTSELNNFTSQPGFTTPTPTSTTSSNTTIGDENWFYQTAYYQSSGQTERIEVYATIHQGKAYIIELQALYNQFDAANTQYFENMLGRFQFQ